MDVVAKVFPFAASKTDPAVPLCVDLDGTLIRTDLLVESWFALLKHRLSMALLAPYWALWGKAHLKARIAEQVDIDVRHLPYHRPFLEYLVDQHRRGRRLVLVTAACEKYARAVAAHLSIFAEVIATDGDVNMSGNQKRNVLIDKFGLKGFDYAGNGWSDVKVFPAAQHAVLVNPVPGVERATRKVSALDRIFRSEEKALFQYLRALRPHQWLKNGLVFVPLLASHQMNDLALFGYAVIAFIAFSLCASSVYLLNDLLDLPADRAHPRKRNRPFASGTASVKVGAVLALLLLFAAAIMALLLPPIFLLVLGIYYVLTLGYSLWLKGKLLVDVLLLATLYTLRILAGAAACVIVPSFWLLAFSMFLFLSLAMVKRYAELVDIKKTDKSTITGRGYEVADMAILPSMGAAAGYCSVLVLALYINSPDVIENYTYPQALWMLCPIVLYWISRMWQRAGRGEMNDDPVVFAIKDRISRWVGVSAAVVVAAAALL